MPLKKGDDFFIIIEKSGNKKSRRTTFFRGAFLNYDSSTFKVSHKTSYQPFISNMLSYLKT